MKEKLFLQLPEGLKIKATELADELESRGFEVVISGEPCYGACDIRMLPGYKTLHYGHSKMLEFENVEYVPWRLNKDCVPVALKAAEKISGRIGLASTIYRKLRKY